MAERGVHGARQVWPVRRAPEAPDQGDREVVWEWALPSAPRANSSSDRGPFPSGLGTGSRSRPGILHVPPVDAHAPACWIVLVVAERWNPPETRRGRRSCGPTALPHRAGDACVWCRAGRAEPEQARVAGNASGRSRSGRAPAATAARSERSRSLNAATRVSRARTPSRYSSTFSPSSEETRRRRERASWRTTSRMEAWRGSAPRDEAR